MRILARLGSPLLLAIPIVAQDAARPAEPPLPGVGDPAPALAFDAVLGGDAAAFAADALRGKVVVLEFSTSWCGGCRDSAPHWNELAKELAGEAIVLLSITNETAEQAATFRKDVALATPLAVDLDGSLFEAFGVPGIPDAVVLDGAGRIAAFTNPRQLTAAALRALAAGEAVTFDGGKPRQRRNWNHQQPLGDGEVAPGAFSLAPSPKPAGMVRTDVKSGTLRAAGVPLRTVVTTALGCTPGDLDLAPELDTKALYDMVARGSDGTVDGARKVARDGLVRDLGLAIETTDAPRDALVLSRLQGRTPPAARTDDKGGSVRAGEIRLGAVTGARLAQVLRTVLPLPVVDETGLAEPFAADLQWDPTGGVEALRAALAGMGLELTTASRPFARHRVTRAAK